MLTYDSTIEEIKCELDKLSKNQQIIFACDCARIGLYLIENIYPDDKRPRLAIEMAESLKYDSKISDAAWLVIPVITGYDITAAVYATIYVAANRVDAAAYSVSWSIRVAQSWRIINNLYKHAYNPLVFPNNYKTPDVLNISKCIIKERDFASCSILADALEDAGCDDENILNHLRTDVLGLSDWVLFSLRQDAL